MLHLKHFQPCPSCASSATTLLSNRLTCPLPAARPNLVIFCCSTANSPNRHTFGSLVTTCRSSSTMDTSQWCLWQPNIQCATGQTTGRTCRNTQYIKLQETNKGFPRYLPISYCFYARPGCHLGLSALMLVFLSCPWASLKVATSRPMLDENVPTNTDAASSPRRTF